MAVWDSYAKDVALSQTNIDTGTATVDSFGDTTGYGAVWRYVVDNGSGTNMRVGIITAVWDDVSDSSPEMSADMSSADIGDTSGVSFAVDKSATTVRLRITVTSDDWSFYAVRTLIGET